MEPNLEPTQPNQPQQPMEPAQPPQPPMEPLQPAQPQSQFTPQNQMNATVVQPIQQPDQPAVGQYIAPGQAIVAPQADQSDVNAGTDSSGLMANKKLLFIIGGAAALLLLGGIAAFILTRSDSESTPSASPEPSSSSLDSAIIASRNTQRQTDVNTIFITLEEFYNENGFYPPQIAEDTLIGIDPEALTDFEGDMVQSTPSASSTKPVNPYDADADIQSDYSYLPYDCSLSGSTDRCDRYVIYARLDDDTAGYSKSSLN